MAQVQEPLTDGPNLPHAGARRWSPRAGCIGALVILLVPLLMLVVGWSMRGLPNLPLPQTRPGKLPDAHWETKAPLETPRDDFGLAVVDGRVWVMGGMSGERGSRLDSTEIYDPATNRWSSGPSLTSGRSSFRAVALGSTIYVFGGASAEHFGIDTVEALDTVTGKWRQLDPLPAALFGEAVVELGGKIYVIGGYSGGRGVGTVYTYEPATNAWRQVSSLPTPRYNLAAAVLNGKIYALGGWVNDGPSAVVEVFDPATGAWTSGPSLISPMSNFGATVLDGRIYAMLHQSHQVFDPRVNKWIGADAMPTSRHGEGLAAVGDTVYAIGGCSEDPQQDLDKVEAYVSGEAVDPDNFQILGADRGGAISVILGAIVTITLCTTLLLVNRRRLAEQRAAEEDED
jgi:hypothetical protein